MYSYSNAVLSLDWKGLMCALQSAAGWVEHCVNLIRISLEEMV